MAPQELAAEPKNGADDRDGRHVEALRYLENHVRRRVRDCPVAFRDIRIRHELVDQGGVLRGPDTRTQAAG